MLELFTRKSNGSEGQNCNPFQAPGEGDFMPEYNNHATNGGNGGAGVGLREGILAGIVAFCAVGAVFYFVITGLIATNSPYVKDKELIFEMLEHNQMDIEESKTDIKKINEQLYDIKIEINRANSYLYKMAEEKSGRE